MQGGKTYCRARAQSLLGQGDAAPTENPDFAAGGTVSSKLVKNAERNTSCVFNADSICSKGTSVNIFKYAPTCESGVLIQNWRIRR